MLLALALVLSYLAGSIPSAVWIGKATHRLDVREHGSGNAGATNVFRVLGWKAGLAVFVVDVFKGWFAAGPLGTLALTSGLVGVDAAAPGAADSAAALGVGVRLACGVLAILGHSFPVFARFKGGKGVATTAGVLLALTPGALGVTVLGFALAFALSRHVALGSLTAAVVYPATLFIERFALGRSIPTPLLVVGTGMGLWLFWTHRSNIRRLLRGEESKLEFGQRVRGPDA